MNINEKSWPEDRVVPQIEKSIDLSETYKTVEDRYYTRFFYQQEDGEDQVVLVHSNRICLVSIAPNHPGVFSQFFNADNFFKVHNAMLQIQCNLDLVTLNLVTTCDLVTIFQRPFFDLLHKIIRFSDTMRFSDNFCRDQKCH